MLFAILELLRHKNLLLFCRAFFLLLIQNCVARSFRGLVCFRHFAEELSNLIKIALVLCREFFQPFGKCSICERSQRSVIYSRFRLVRERSVWHLSVDDVEHAVPHKIAAVVSIEKIVYRSRNCCLCSGQTCAAIDVVETVRKYKCLLLLTTKLERNLNFISFFIFSEVKIWFFLK